MAVELERGPASQLHQRPFRKSRVACHGKSAEGLIRRTAVVRTRMPGGVGGAASRDAPLSRLTAASTTAGCVDSGATHFASLVRVFRNRGEGRAVGLPSQRADLV